MRQYRIEITDLAVEDLENAGDYIAYQLMNPLAAVRTVEGIRNDYYKNYKIYYVVKNDVIYVVRILHMRVDS